MNTDHEPWHLPHMNHQPNDSEIPMKPSHFRTPRQLDEAQFYSSQTSGPVGVDPFQVPFLERLVTWVAALIIVGVLGSVALGWI